MPSKGINPVQHSERSSGKAKKAAKGINPVQHSERSSFSRAMKKESSLSSLSRGTSAGTKKAGKKKVAAKKNATKKR